MSCAIGYAGSALFQAVRACQHAKPVADSHRVQVCGVVDILIVATKPQYVAPVLQENAEALKSTLVVSIAAGKTLENLTDALGNPGARVIRVMPNTPCMVGASAAAMCKGEILTGHISGYP